MVSSASLALAEQPPTDRSGSCIADRYHLHAQIGRGGMATVYRGHDVQLARAVAIKLLHPERASATYQRRMLQEGRAAVQTDHPNLLRIFDVGCFEGATFLVMELLTGRSLADHLREQPMSWLDIVALLAPAADAFAALHAAGLVHRDIKPANLFVRQRGRAAEIVVVDFGLAKMAPEMFEQAGLVRTQTGMLMGTPAYMAPEQANGDGADARSDIYSFGVTLYEALAGHPPFPPEPGDNWVSLLTKHMYADVPPLPDHVPHKLAAIVERSLAKFPDERFQSMPDLAAALRCCLPDPARPTPVRVTSPPVSVPRRRWWILAAVPLIATVVSVSTTTDSPEATRIDIADPIALDLRFPWPRAPERAPIVTSAQARDENPPQSVRQPSPGALARLKPIVVACMQEFGDPDAQDARVTLTFDRRGHLTAATLSSNRSPRVGACVVQRVATRFTGAGTVTHTFRWTIAG